jgi:hypothetical protein
MLSNRHAVSKIAAHYKIIGAESKHSKEESK